MHEQCTVKMSSPSDKTHSELTEIDFTNRRVSQLLSGISQRMKDWDELQFIFVFFFQASFRSN